MKKTRLSFKESYFSFFDIIIDTITNGDIKKRYISVIALYLDKTLKPKTNINKLMNNAIEKYIMKNFSIKPPLYLV